MAMFRGKRAACWAILIFCISAIPAGLAGAQEPFRLIPGTRFLLGMDWEYLWISGDTLIPAGGRPDSGSKVDISSDLGVDQSEGTSVSFQATILDTHLINFDYLMYSPTGLKRPSRTFVFHNRTYTPDNILETKVDLNWLRLSYGYKLWDLSLLWVAPRLGVHHIRSTTTINGTTEEEGISSNTRSLDGTYPVLGLETRFLFPYGIDVGMELEGTHLITRGFLTMLRLKAQWEIHPDVVLTLGGSSRIVQYLETEQPLNNEWFYALSGWSAGIAFAF
jgi:hypothetical protein